MTKTIEEIIENIPDHMQTLVSNFLYYDRKNDEDFTVSDAEVLMEMMTHHPELIDVLVESFRKELKKVIEE